VVAELLGLFGFTVKVPALQVPPPHVSPLVAPLPPLPSIGRQDWGATRAAASVITASATGSDILQNRALIHDKRPDDIYKWRGRVLYLRRAPNLLGWWNYCSHGCLSKPDGHAPTTSKYGCLAKRLAKHGASKKYS
jgi:hypothetical protein